MGDASFKAGLTGQDELGQFPSAVNPLTALGIDPDMARANPELLAALQPQMGQNAPVPGQPQAVPTPGPMKMPTGVEEAVTVPEAPPGGRAGGTGVPASIPTPTTGAHAPLPPSSATDYGMAGLGMLDQNAQMATQAAREIPVINPEAERLAAERDKLDPPQLYDPQTGKMLQEVQEYDPATGKTILVNPKPSVGQRIWRGVRGGLVGLATGGIPGAVVGALEPQDIVGGTAYGAPNSTFQKAEVQRGQQLDATNAGLKTSFDNWKAQVDAAKAKAGEFRANAGIANDETKGATGMINAATDAQKEQDTARNQANNSPEAKLRLNQQEYDQRAQRVAAMPNLSQLQKTLYMLNGKIPDPQQPNEAEVNAAQAARALVVFKAQHGGQGPQTLDDFNQVQAAARGMMDRGKAGGGANEDTQVGSIVADAIGKKQEFADKYERNADGSYRPKGTYDGEDAKGTLSAQQFADRLEQLGRLDPNMKLRRLGAQIDAQGNVVRMGAGASAPAAAMAAARPPSAIPPARALGTVQGTDGKTYWTSDGKTADLGAVAP